MLFIDKCSRGVSQLVEKEVTSESGKNGFERKSKVNAEILGGYAKASFTMDVYAHALPSKQEEAAQLMDDLLTPLVESNKPS